MARAVNGALSKWAEHKKNIAINNEMMCVKIIIKTSYI